MGSLFGWTVAVFAVVWIALAIRRISRQSKRSERFNWLVWIGGFFVVLGAAGFFGAALSSFGMVKLPFRVASGVRERGGYVTKWPSHCAARSIRPRSGLRLSDWRYLRGWQVAAEGGPFKIVTSQPDKIEIYVSISR
jgi:hypothetical protein